MSHLLAVQIVLEGLHSHCQTTKQPAPHTGDPSKDLSSLLSSQASRLRGSLPPACATDFAPHPPETNSKHRAPVLIIRRHHFQNAQFAPDAQAKICPRHINTSLAAGDWTGPHFSSVRFSACARAAVGLLRWIAQRSNRTWDLV